jgi:glycine betaine catabolism B
MITIRVLDLFRPEQLKQLILKPETSIIKECLIGRNSHSSIVLHGSEISRIHGKISVKNNDYYFTDLASLYGSILNHEKVHINQDYLLHSGDIIKIGRYILIVSDINTEEQNYTATPQQVEACMELANIKSVDIPHWTTGNLTVRCIQVIDETDDVKTFRFIAEKPVLFTYKPGQCVTLNFNIDDQDLYYSYPISSTPSRPHTLEITVKRLDRNIQEFLASKVSNWLHDQIKVGSKIQLISTHGEFTCLEYPSPKLLFISSGSRICSIMSMCRWILDTGCNCDVILFYSVRSLNDIIFREELEMMSLKYPNFHLAITTTREESINRHFISNFNEILLLQIAPDFLERTIFINASNPFIASVGYILKTQGFPMQNFHMQSLACPRGPSLYNNQMSGNYQSSDRSPLWQLFNNLEREKKYTKLSEEALSTTEIVD